MVDTKVDFKTHRTSPLDGAVWPVGPITLSEKKFLGKINIRGNADDAAFLAAAKKALGVALPLAANTVSMRKGKKAVTVFWLGPDEWLVHSADGSQISLLKALQTAFKGLHTAVTDVSDYFVVIELHGSTVHDLLARGCPLDLHPRTFKPGDCAQSYFAKASILLHRVDDDHYTIQVRWTFAQYLWDYLVQSADMMAA